MPGQARLGDNSKVDADGHGCICCVHTCVGPATVGSPDVNVNSMPAVRVDDTGVHSTCCGDNTWIAKAGSSTVFINNKAAHRRDDADQHCGGMGRMVEASENVIVGG